MEVKFGEKNTQISKITPEFYVLQLHVYLLIGSYFNNENYFAL